MNSKYPIAINKVSARKNGVPKEYICPGKSGDDSHKHKLVLAKLKAIQWCISQSELPSDEHIKVADVSLTNSREECNKYYNTDWSKSLIKWGQPVMERRIVKTKDPIFEMNPSLREPHIKEILFPEITMPSQKIAQSDIIQMKEIMELSFDGKIALLRQIRILINSLDIGERYLPVLPGSDQATVSLKHALNHTNFVLINFSLKTTSKADIYEEELENMGLCCIFEAKLSKLESGDIKEILRSTTTDGEGVTKLIDYAQKVTGMGTRWLKSLFSHPITLERVYTKILICPFPTGGVRTVIYNTKNVCMKIMQASGNNNFRLGDNRGTFVRSATVPLSISVNFTSLRDLKHVLATIGS